MPKISVIMPVYNVEPYLRECLDSVRAQTFTDWECICVDDGSTDASPAILDEYAAKDSRFRVIRREHSNAGAARNIGMDIAQGEFLSFLDSDDVFSQKMLEIMHYAIEKCASDIAICRAKWFHTADGTPTLPVRQANRFIVSVDNPSRIDHFFDRWQAEPWTKLFRRSFVEKLCLRFQEQRSSNDLFFVRTSITLAKRISDVQIPLVAYRRHSQSLQATKSKSPLCTLASLRAMEAELEKRHAFENDPTLHKRLHVWFVSCILWNMEGLLEAKAYADFHEQSQLFLQDKEFSLLTEEDIGHKDQYLRFDAIRMGCSPLESALLHRRLLEQSFQNRLQDILHSRSYRIGRALLYLPRIIRSLIR